MFSRFFKSLFRLSRKWSYFVISILIATAIAINDVPPLHSKVVTPTLVEESSFQGTKHLVNLATFSNMVAKLEQKWETDYEDYFGRNFSHSSRTANKIAKRLTEIKEQSGINSAVIWAVPKDDFLQLMLITPQRQYTVEKIRGANRARLTARINELENAIADRHSLEYYPPARIIYDWIFKPLDPYLEAENIDTLLLCTGPMLRSLPFSALHDGEQFAIEKYNLARIPAFSLMDSSYNALSSKKVLAMGASEFRALPSLPGVKIELNTIVPKLWSGKKMLNDEFTIDNLQQAHETGNFDVVHLATHSYFNPGAPEKSYIQFSDRKLGLDKLSNLELDAPQVDLLVLSSCETALGNKDAEFGFAGLAMQAGVKSALASLWRINDMGTVVLMSEFYQQLKLNKSKSAALRTAQVNLIQQKAGIESGMVQGSQIRVKLPKDLELNLDETKNYRHPFYWAGFTIIGNPW